MDTVSLPKLTEPGAIYFFKETLKKCNIRKRLFFNNVLNLVLLVSFLGVLGVLLMYKKNNKLTVEERDKMSEERRTYLLDHIKSFREKRQREDNETITSLPKFENTFIQMHKNYYNI